KKDGGGGPRVYRRGAGRRGRGHSQTFPPPRRLDCARASERRLRGQNPSAEPRAYPGQAGRLVPAILITGFPLLKRSAACQSPASRSSRRGVASRGRAGVGLLGSSVSAGGTAARAHGRSEAGVWVGVVSN